MSAVDAREYILFGNDRSEWLRRAEEILKTCASIPARRVAEEIVMRFTEPKTMREAA